MSNRATLTLPHCCHSHNSIERSCAQLRLKSEFPLVIDVVVLLDAKYSNDLPCEHSFAACCHRFKCSHTLTLPVFALPSLPTPFLFVGLFLRVEDSHTSDRRRVRGVPSSLCPFSSFSPPSLLLFCCLDLLCYYPCFSLLFSCCLCRRSVLLN